MSKQGLIIASLVGGICVGALLALIFVRILLPKYRVRKAFQKKKKRTQEDMKQWYSFMRNSSQQQPQEYSLSPNKPPSNGENNVDVERAVRSIYPESLHRFSDLPLRNSLTPPNSSPTVMVEKEATVRVDPEQECSPSKPLVLQGVPTQKFRTRQSTHPQNDSEYRVQAMGNYRNIDGIFIKFGAQATEQTPVPRPLVEYNTGKCSLETEHRDNRASFVTTMSHITTGALVGEAVEMDMRSVSPAVVDVVSPNGTKNAAHNMSPFSIGDDDASEE
jgi:hypothetical protein